MRDSVRLMGANDELLRENFHAIQTQLGTPASIRSLARMHCNGTWGDTYLLAAFNVLVGFDAGYELKFFDDGATYVLGKAMKQEDPYELERIAAASAREPFRSASKRGVLADYTLLNLANRHFLLLCRKSSSGVDSNSTNVIQTNKNGNCFFDALAIMYERVSGMRLSEASMRRLVMCIMRRFFLTRTQRQSLHAELQGLQQRNVVQKIECLGYVGISAPRLHSAAVNSSIRRGAPRYFHIDVARNQRQKRFDGAIPA
jgi:hypothetical protein